MSIQKRVYKNQVAGGSALDAEAKGGNAVWLDSADTSMYCDFPIYNISGNVYSIRGNPVDGTHEILTLPTVEVYRQQDPFFNFALLDVLPAQADLYLLDINPELLAIEWIEGGTALSFSFTNIKSLILGSGGVASTKYLWNICLDEVVVESSRNLVVDGTFDTPDDGNPWSTGSDWEISGGTLNAIGGSGYSYSTQTGIFEQTKHYRVRIDLPAIVSASVDVHVGDVKIIGMGGFLNDVVGTYGFNAESVDANTALGIQSMLFNGSVDNIEVEEIIVGEDLIFNGNLLTGNSWTLNASSWVYSDVTHRFEGIGNYDKFSQITLQSGHNYEATIVIDEYTSGAIDIVGGDDYSGVGTHVIPFTAASTLFEVRGVNFFGFISSISCVEV